MGLDICVYSNLNFVATDEEFAGKEDEAYDKGYIHLYLNESSPDRSDGLKPGWYEVRERSCFRAGSYSGYNNWRDLLAFCMHKKHAEEIWANPDNSKPFVPLINFSDCEGFIGPETSKVLHRDFETHRKKAEKFASSMQDPAFLKKLWRPDPFSGGFRGPELGDHEWFLKKYGEWQNAFAEASQNGLVRFC